MKERRLELSDIFRDILGNTNTYFQPPINIRMNYPAIVYKLSDIKSVHADNGVYLSDPRYMATLIVCNPDSELVFRMAEIPTARFIRHYTEDNLNYYIYEIY